MRLKVTSLATFYPYTLNITTFYIIFDYFVEKKEARKIPASTRKGGNN
jgi:hypothetical protein